MLVGTEPRTVGPSRKEREMLAVVLFVLFGTCVAAPFLGVDSGDSRSERARPEQGWYPAAA